MNPVDADKDDKKKKRKRRAQAAQAAFKTNDIHDVVSPRWQPSGDEDDDAPAQKFGDYCTTKVIEDDSILSWWKMTSGLHTVEKWVKNYQKHPAGWAALLTIHGIPEVTARLRSKVENYAMYSALFLSATIPVVMAPPSVVVTCNDVAKLADIDWECEIRKRIFFYPLVASIAAHMLCIVLAMAFVNALNETARDSDVFRMFARGQGYKATVKCQYSFRLGAFFAFVSMIASAHTYIGYEVIVLTVVLMYVCFRIAKGTAHLLFSNGSIVKYWRSELGGKPDADDPYDLQVPMDRFAERAKLSKDFRKEFDNEAEAESEADEPAEEKSLPPQAPAIKLLNVSEDEQAKNPETAVSPFESLLSPTLGRPMEAGAEPWSRGGASRSPTQRKSSNGEIYSPLRHKVN
jgi:hypothetical protein